LKRELVGVNELEELGLVEGLELELIERELVGVKEIEEGLGVIV
jgi:hypothetical protein